MTTVGSLCSGYGGLDLAALDLWPDAHVAWHSEIDPHANTVLAVNWPATPNLGDLTAVDWAGVEPVDVLTAGYPCQPFSTAGRRQGDADPRHIWPAVLRAVRCLRPRLVLLENVAGHLSLGFGRVLGDLAEAGYDARWTCVRAADVGAPHRRDRVFIAAHPADAETLRREGSACAAQGPLKGARWAGGAARLTPANADRSQPGTNPGGSRTATLTRPADGPERWGEPRSDVCRDAFADAGCVRLGVRGERGPGQDEDTGRSEHPAGRCFGPYQPAVDRWAAVLGRPAPPPLTGRRLNPEFVEFMMGLPDGWVTDHVPARHALRILGNGVVPQQAEHAYRTLLGGSPCSPPGAAADTLSTGLPDRSDSAPANRGQVRGASPPALRTAFSTRGFQDA